MNSLNTIGRPAGRGHPAPRLEAGALDTATLRRALGAFATGVTVVTTLDPEGRPVGLTANSFTSVSMDPPLVLWCLATRSTSLPAFRHAGSFVINVLHADQGELCRRFSTPTLQDRFAGVAWSEGHRGMPVLDGCVANYECEAWSEHEAGDHQVFIGRLTHLAHLAGDPLVFSGGRLGNFHKDGNDHHRLAASTARAEA